MPEIDIIGARSLIARLSLKEITDRLVSRRKLKRSQVHDAESAYRHFMLLVWANRHGEQEPKGGSVVPSVLADVVWHEHILFTKNYRKFCEELSGLYIDHTPSPPKMTEEDKLARRNYTRSLHRAIPDRLWFVTVFLSPERVAETQAGMAPCACDDTSCDCGDCD